MYAQVPLKIVYKEFNGLMNYRYRYEHFMPVGGFVVLIRQVKPRGNGSQQAKDTLIVSPF